MRNIIITLLLLPSILLGKYELSVAAIFQNESRFLAEWIDYHLMMGVDHFWLYNNNSTDDYQEVLQRYIDGGVVDLIEWPSVPLDNDWENFSFNTQVSAYNNAIAQSKNKTKWLAIIDTDEFMLPMKGTLKKLLKSYKKENAIALQWVCFGTSHQYFCPSGFMLGMLYLRLPIDHPGNGWYKCIVKPKEVVNCPNPHYCNLKKGIEAVVPREIARINHYWTRDERFLYDVKIPRYEKWGGRREDILQRANSMNQEFDSTLIQILDNIDI